MTRGTAAAPRSASRGNSRIVRWTVGGVGAPGLPLAVAGVATVVAPRSWTSARRLPAVRAHLADDTLDPSDAILNRGRVRFEVTNDGTAPACVAVRGPDTFAATGELPPGRTAALDVTLVRAGAYELDAVSPSRGSLAVRP